MGQRLAASVLALVVGFSLPARAATQSDGERTARKVVALFNGHSDETIDAFLMHLRPAPLDEVSRAKVLASLPREGALQPSRKDGEKLAAAQRVLDYSARNSGITARVIDVDSAFVGLYYRTVVLVSARALALLNADELAALVAHEAGHDGDWNEYAAAMKSNDSETMRELELKADGIAVLTLQHLGIEPGRLSSAIQKMMRYNDWQDRSAGVTQAVFGAPDRYVSLDERLAFIQAIQQIRWADWPTASSLQAVRK